MGGKKKSFGFSAMGGEGISYRNTHTKHTQDVMLEAVQDMTSILNICPAHREMKEGQWTPHNHTETPQRVFEQRFVCNSQVSTAKIQTVYFINQFIQSVN